MVMNIEDPKEKGNEKSFALFALGFRPFFLFAAFSSFALIVLWLYELSGKITISGYYTPAGWHAHEMLFGYAVAVIAGFLLTAAGNWTGMKMINGKQLVLLSVVFLLGRFAPFIPELPHWIIATVDLAFLPLVALLIAIPVFKVKQWSNFVFVPLLLTMAAANLMVHLSALGMIDISIVLGSRLMIYLVILLIVIMGGRVIPFFTERGVVGVTTKTWVWIERLSSLSVILMVLGEVFFSDSVIIGYLAMFAAVTNFIRVAGWYSNKIWQVPLVWILQIAYLWIVFGFVIKGWVIFDINESLFAFHAFTVGGIGIMTLGMMARVSIGHTGREMVLSSWMTLAFILINIAAITRVIMPMFMPHLYLFFIQFSGWLWVSAFIIFFVIYTPMWIRPRIDGRPG
ncbi:MAG: NnrS family protein [Gammaproteobacteria bacterium]|nr:NnrS family protein [Gammaproteobacteria bacterium]